MYTKDIVTDFGVVVKDVPFTSREINAGPSFEEAVIESSVAKLYVEGRLLSVMDWEDYAFAFTASVIREREEKSGTDIQDYIALREAVGVELANVKRNKQVDVPTEAWQKRIEREIACIKPNVDCEVQAILKKQFQLEERLEKLEALNKI